jgi:hypothetical protein
MITPSLVLPPTSPQHINRIQGTNIAPAFAYNSGVVSLVEKGFSLCIPKSVSNPTLTLVLSLYLIYLTSTINTPATDQDGSLQ